MSCCIKYAEDGIIMMLLNVIYKAYDLQNVKLNFLFDILTSIGFPK